MLESHSHSQIIEELTRQVRGLQGVVESLQKRIKELEEENIRLKERLSLNSRNSSIPSSKDSNKTPKTSKPSDRKPGGQPGHEGKGRSNSTADETIEIKAPDVCECGGRVIVCEKPYIKQKVDLPEIKPHVTEYHLHHGRCCKCGKRINAKLPSDSWHGVFGPRIKAVVAALTGFYKSSKQEAASILRDMFGVPISTGSISNIEQSTVVRTEEICKQIESSVKKSPVMHIDETGHKKRGQRSWCWVFAGEKGSFFKLGESRGKKVLAKNMPGTQSVVVSDRYAAYNYFSEEDRQVCWAHLARDFERLAQSHYCAVRVPGIRLKETTAELFFASKALRSGLVTQSEFVDTATVLRGRMYSVLQRMTSLPKSLQAQRVAKNILKVEPMMWKFLQDPSKIPLTNNLAERRIHSEFRQI